MRKIFLVAVLCLATLTSCSDKKINAKNLNEAPLCSTGDKAELDINSIKKRYYDDYKKLPWTARKLDFRVKICKPD